MPTLYMTFWSVFMIIALGLGRLRNWRQITVLFLVTALVLFLSQSLYIQLSVSAGLDPSAAWYASSDFLRRGPLGWLALLVMPCGWLGPMVGLNLIHRWYKTVDQFA